MPVTITRESVLQALSAIQIDAAGTNLVASGRLSDIVVDPGSRVMFSIAIQPEEAAAMEAVRRSAEATVQGLAGVKGVFVSLTSDREMSKDAPAAPSASKGRTAYPKGQPIPGIRHVIAIASGKGGVGKSTTACNLALGLQALGLKVGVLDADIYGPSMPRLFGIQGKPKILEGRLLEPMDGYGIKVMSIGFLVDEDAAMIWRGPMVMSAINQMLREVVWGDLDILVVDMPPGTGDAQLTMAQATPLAGAVIVSTPQDLALIDARRGVVMFKKVNVPILGIVENMATFICPQCGHATSIFGHGGAREEAERLGVPFLGEIPLTLSIREMSDSGRPVVATAPQSAQALPYQEMAKRITAALKL